MTDNSFIHRGTNVAALSPRPEACSLGCKHCTRSLHTPLWRLWCRVCQQNAGCVFDLLEGKGLLTAISTNLGGYGEFWYWFYIQYYQILLPCNYYHLPNILFMRASWILTNLISAGWFSNISITCHVRVCQQKFILITKAVKGIKILSNSPGPVMYPIVDFEVDIGGYQQSIGRAYGHVSHRVLDLFEQSHSPWVINKGLSSWFFILIFSIPRLIPGLIPRAHPYTRQTLVGSSIPYPYQSTYLIHSNTPSSLVSIDTNKKWHFWLRSLTICLAFYIAIQT